MLCILDIFLAFILILFLQIEEGGGSCSPAKKAECGAIWRTCLNERCGECVIEIDGECYSPNYADDALLQRLENCDPNTNPDCKRSLGDVSEQLLAQLGNDDAKPVNNVKAEQLSENEPNQDNDDSKTSTSGKNHPVRKSDDDDDNSGDIPDVYFLIIIIACTLSGVAGIALSGYCWYKLHYSDDKMNKGDYIPGVKKQNSKNTPSKNADRKLDYKAEMYHYVHTKNQIAAMEKAKSDHLSSGAISNDEDDDDEAEDYTVYECPGLAPTGDMTVVNPLFSDQEVTVSDEGRAQSTHSSPTTPSRSDHSPSR